MKIFYGVQGTGNGHITRARVMAKEFNAAGIDVSFQFSGRSPEKYFDMGVFKNYKTLNGLTFNVNKGEVSYFKTALQTKPFSFIREVKSLDLSGYDLIISDFEPVTCWAAKLQNRKVLGIGHQYAFNYQIPREGSDFISDQLMKYFAPADTGIGLHWHHFNQQILPPIIDTPAVPDNVIKNKIVVYLPFEDPNEVITLLSPYAEYDFQIFAPLPVESLHSHISCHPLSYDAFKKALYDCRGIISNAGFELASESLHLGKKILVKPLHSQMEQISNAAALQQLGYGKVMNDLDGSLIGQWLKEESSVQISYPNTAKLLVERIKNGITEIDADFTERVWSGVSVKRINH